VSSRRDTIVLGINLSANLTVHIVRARALKSKIYFTALDIVVCMVGSFVRCLVIFRYINQKK